MRDDLAKLPLPKSAKKYARMTSKDLGDDWSKKVDMYINMAADVTNQGDRKQGFKNKDASGKVKHAFKESAERVVARLLGENDDLLGQMGDVANSPQELYKLAREALNFMFGEGQGMVGAIHSALEAVGAVRKDGPLMCDNRDSVADRISDYLSSIETDGDVEGSVDGIKKTLDNYATPLIGEGATWALMKIFQEEAQGIYDAQFDEEGEVQQQNENPIDDWDEEPEVYESIKASALRTHDGTVFTSDPGGAHIACVQQASQAGKTWDDEGLGFVTDDGRFVTRDEAELIGLKHGQLNPDISDPGMIHAHDFAWMEGMDRGYRFVTNCVSCDDVDALNDMIDSAVDVTYQEFMRNVPISAIFDSGIGYSYYWTPAQAILGGVPYEEVARNRPLTLKKDWHVSYHKSTYQGKPCYFMVHSAIEYVFVKD